MDFLLKWFSMCIFMKKITTLCASKKALRNSDENQYNVTIRRKK